MNILMIIAPEDFRDEEYKIPLDYFRNNGFHVETASIRKGACKGKLGMIATASKELSEINTDDYDAIVFIGGPGTPVLRKSPHAIRIAKEAFEEKKIVAAICWAPTILAKAGILKNRRATVWQGNDSEFGMMTSEYLEQQGAYYTGDSATKDERIITADGPKSAGEFAELIIKTLND